MRLEGRRLHVAGSGHVDDDAALVSFAHASIAKIVRDSLIEGAGVVVQIVPEPRHPNGAPLIFDWTVLAEAAAFLADHPERASTGAGPLITAVGSEQVLDDPPAERLGLLRGLMQAHPDGFRLVPMPAGWKAGAVARQVAAVHGDMLVTLGGGEGVEHLAGLYMQRCRPVVPLDIPLTASRNDGSLGGLGLARRAASDADRFFRLRNGVFGATQLEATSHRFFSDPAAHGAAVVELLATLERPSAMCVRLLDDEDPDFRDVETFFRQVADPVVDALGFEIVEVGTTRPISAFINVEIFERLFHSSAVIVDVTGLRPNCFMELGYALGRDVPTVVCARKGTKLPFDGQAIPTLFWEPSAPIDERRDELEAWWRKTVNRPSLIAAPGLF